MTKEYNLDKFHRGLKTLGLSLTEGQIGQFLRYYELLAEWNERMNLTAITDFDDVVDKHFLDSLCLIKAVPGLGDQKLLDMGTGAGFPGIPLKIAFPGLDVVLADSVEKKLRFLDVLTGELGLFGVTIVHGRAEDLARETEYRERFDLVVSRAVAELAVLSEYCLPFVRVGGSFVAYKAADVEGECAQAKKAVCLLGGEMEPVVRYDLPGTDVARSLILIEKNKGTPQAYPRRSGTPGRAPLK